MKMLVPATIAVAGIALLALAVVSASTTAITSILNEPILPSLSTYAPETLFLNVTEPLAPSLSVYYPEQVSKTVSDAITSGFSAYLPEQYVSALQDNIIASIAVTGSAEKITSSVKPVVPVLLIGRLVGNLTTPYANSTVATLSHIEWNFPIVNRTIILDVPNTTYIQKTTNITVKIVDPATGEVDRTFTGWVRVVVDNSNPIDAYIDNGIGTVTLSFSSTGHHSVEVSLLNGAGGWGSNGSVGGWNPDDVPGYVVAPSNITVKATTTTTLIPTEIVLTKFEYHWMNESYVAITLKGYVADAVTGEHIPGGSVEISVLKGTWHDVGNVTVDRNGNFMWEGTVDPAWVKLAYLPNSTIYLSSSKQLPLFEAQAVGRALGGKASPVQPYLAVAWMAPALASATALVCLLRKRGKEG